MRRHVGLGLLALSLAGCSALPGGGAPALRDTGPADQHAIQSQTLAEIMRSLRNVVYHQKLNALQVEEDRRRLALRMAEQVSHMSGTILVLAGEGGPIVVDGQDRPAFTALVMQLRTHAEEIRWLAESDRVDEIGPAVNRMVVTCDSCHDRFRDMRRGR